MTRWYPVPPGDELYWIIKDRSGTNVATAVDEPTANHIAELHNQYAVPEQSGDEMQEDQPLKPGDKVYIQKPSLDESPGWIKGMGIFDGAYSYVSHVLPGGQVSILDSEYLFNPKWLTKV